MRRVTLMSAALLALAGCAIEDTPESAIVRQACHEGDLGACQWIDARDREIRAQRIAAVQSDGPTNTTCFGSGNTMHCTSY